MSNTASTRTASPMTRPAKKKKPTTKRKPTRAEPRAARAAKAAPIPRILITPGEPAGIGPDLLVQLAQQAHADAELVAVCDPELLQSRAKKLKLPLSLELITLEVEPFAHEAGKLSVLPVALAAPVTPGTLDPRNAHYVLEALTLATRWCLEGHAH